MYDGHGWHEFRPSWQGPDWCEVCDCLVDDHVTLEDYTANVMLYDQRASAYRKLRAEEEYR